MSYINVAELRNYTGIDASQIGDTEMQMYIDASEELIHSITGTIFTTASTTEIIDGEDSEYIVLSNIPIISVTKVEYSTDEGLTYTELDSKYYSVKDWAIRLRKTRPFTLSKDVDMFRVTYTYGHSSVPNVVKVCDLKLAGIFAIKALKDRDDYIDTFKLGDMMVRRRDLTLKEMEIKKQVADDLSGYTYKEIILVR